MPFTEIQIAALKAPLDPKNVKPPAPGKHGDYIEGWRVIDEANRIFGFDMWTREMIYMAETNRELLDLVDRDGKEYKQWRVGYIARVRINACGVIREGTGFGSGQGKPEALSDVIESAVKEAETDAMKRALMTFGNPFGLALYDKTKANVQAPPKAVPKELPADIQGLIKRVGDMETTMMLQMLWKAEGAAAYEGPHGEAVNDAFNARKAQVELMDRSSA